MTTPRCNITVPSARWSLATLALAAAGLLLHAAVSAAADDKVPAAGAKPSAKPALTVAVVAPQTSTLSVTVAANGSITAWQDAVVGAEFNGGRLADVRVNVGDVVRRGQVLATFGADIAQAELAQSRASVAEAEATLADAAANAQRARELDQSGALSAQVINQYQTAERTAQARLEAVRATARTQQLRLSQTTVRAPDNGIISARSATVGAVVPAGQELFRLIRGGRLEWRAEVAAADLAAIKPGQTVRVSPNGGAALAGTVRMVAPTVDPATRNGLVYVDLPAGAVTAGSARAGMFARGEFAVGASAALTLPQSAVLLRDGFSYVFKIGPENRVTQAKVAVGRRVGDRVELTAGLEPNARVVASGAGFLADGDTVRVVDAAAAPAAAAAPNPAAPAAPVAKKT